MLASLMHDAVSIDRELPVYEHLNLSLQPAADVLAGQQMQLLVSVHAKLKLGIGIFCMLRSEGVN